MKVDLNFPVVLFLSQQNCCYSLKTYFFTFHILESYTVSSQKKLKCFIFFPIFRLCNPKIFRVYSKNLWLAVNLKSFNNRRNPGTFSAIALLYFFCESVTGDFSFRPGRKTMRDVVVTGRDYAIGQSRAAFGFQCILFYKFINAGTEALSKRPTWNASFLLDCFKYSRSSRVHPKF